MLINQYRILSLLDLDNKEEYDQHVEILEHGFQSGYDEMVDGLDETFPEEECHFVIGTLNMFEMIGRSIEEKNIKLPEDKKWIAQFLGFDGNGEAVYMSYSKFVIHSEGKFQRFKDLDLNSHSPCVSRYRRMLEAWEKLPVGEQCNPSEKTVLSILAA
jgi:hypothetical protein